MNAPTRPKDSEELQRIRRIETRVTSIMIALGLRAPTHKPTFVENTIVIPSPDVSVKDLLAVIPPGHVELVDVYIGREYLFTILP